MVLVGLCVLGIALGAYQNSFHAKGQVDRVTSLIRGAVSPISNSLSEVGQVTSNFLGGLFSVNRLIRENRMLKEQATVFAQYQETVEVKDETISTLRKLLEFGPVQGHTRIQASTIGFSINENRLTINVGSKQGVAAGCPVESADGLVGTVEEVEANASQVLLITSAGLQQGTSSKASLIGALDISRNPVQVGMLRGENATTLSLEFQDPKAPVQIGDTIVTSGYSDKIPRGLLIGKVIQVEPNEAFGYLKARIDPSFDPSRLELVYVLK